jgi:hypothetical protein
MRIGDTVTYIGDRHPSISGHQCRVVSIHRDYHVDPERGPVLHVDGAEAQPNDLIEIAPFLDSKGRWSWVTHDANLEELGPA